MTSLTAPSPQLAQHWMRPALLIMFVTICTAAAAAITATAAPNNFTSPAALFTHLTSVFIALPLGAFVLTSKKGNAHHKMMGRVWASAMMLTALSSFGLRGLTGGIGPIHILSVIMLISIPRAIWNARRGRIDLHRRGMILPYIGLFMAGGAAMIPGRLLPILIFG